MGLNEAFGQIEQSLTDLMRTVKELEKKVSDLDLKVSREDKKRNLPDWINTARALEILKIKDPDTLNKYAAQGLLEKQKGPDKKNYYKTEDVLSLPSKIIGRKAA